MLFESFRSTGLEDRVDYLKENASNAWDFYLISYLNYAFLMNVAALEGRNLHDKYALREIFNSEEDVQKYTSKEFLTAAHKNLSTRNISNHLLYDMSKNNTNYPLWLGFFRAEQQDAKELAATGIQKVQEYASFLKARKKTVKNLGFFFYNKDYSNRSIKFKDYAKPKLGEDFIDLENYEALLNALMRELDYYYRQEHLFWQKEISNKEAWKKINALFKYEQHASPIVFIEYTKELIIYKRLLKNWLLMEVEKRKREFEWETQEVPEPYFALTQYANRLLDPREKEYLIKDSPEFFQYPKHIFASFKAYQLFKYYMPSIVNQARLTFIYKYMRTIERKDYKILVDPAPFKEWYYAQKENPEFFEIKQALEKVRNKERVKDYEVIKNLIEELYPEE